MDLDGPIGPDLSHPDSVIRLASAIHRFRCPEISPEQRISYERSFKSASENHPETQAALRKADTFRTDLADSLVLGNKKGAHQQVIKCAKEYLPLIHKILLTCKVQPEVARLDERLFFNWASGLEKSKKFIKSEALMFEMIMVIVCQALGTAGAASDACIAGDFPGAGRELKKAAGIMKFLAEDQLPKWISRGTNVEDKELPVEASVGICDSFKTLFLAVGQQMAIATVLVKPGIPNYTLVAKLCLGVAENLETFVNTIRSKAALQKEKIDPNFFTLITFQIGLHNALCLYFGARGIWEGKDKYGIAIVMLRYVPVSYHPGIYNSCDHVWFVYFPPTSFSIKQNSLV
uniref:BRO1 domain-containing protein n=2 Tax=Ditylum brightwellii TaxID=49249 RepID=A0A7S4WC64_9STRA